jgi:type I restriction enzyme S subunit
LNLVPIKDIAKIHYGKALKKDDRVESGSVDVFGSNGPVGNHDEFLFEEPTVIIGRKGSVGKTIYTEEKSWTIDTAFYSEIDNDKVDVKYFYYALTAKDMEQYAITTSIPGINRNDIYDLKIPLPSLSEQKAIVAKLDRAQRLIDIDKEMLAKYDDIIQSVFLEMFGDPVTNSKGWEVKKLGEVGTLARGKSKHRPRNDPSILGGKYPLIQTGDVSNAGLFITDYDSTYNEQGLKQSKLWDKGTLCITIAANIAKVGILDFDACFPDSVVGFKSEQASSIFIYSWMGFLQNIIEEQAPVSAQKNINLRILRDLDIIFPPLEMQKKFEAAVLGIHSERKKITLMNSKSEELFSSLVQGAFR